MEVVVDGIIYETQSHGGISRLYSEILPRMCAMDDTLRITMLTTVRRRQRLPSHARIHYMRVFPADKVLRRLRLWPSMLSRARALAQSLAIGHKEGQIWHSTYYTMLAKWNGPQVVTVLDMIYERFRDLFVGTRNDQVRAQQARCILAADAIICVSDTTRQDVMRFHGVESSKTYVVPLGYSSAFGLKDQGDRRTSLPSHDPFFLYVGSRAHYKNFRALLRGYRTWRQRTGEAVRLAVVGPVWSPDEQRLLSELGIADHVGLIVRPTDDQLCALYNEAVAFIYPSLYEGFGIPLLEAMACGCPIVASRIPSTIEVAGPCPIYFDPGAVESLIQALDVAISEGKGSQRVATGLEWVRRYSWERTARQTLAVYRSLQ